jgi:SAM-dependent methyltransferase
MSSAGDAGRAGMHGETADRPLTERLLALLDHLGLERVHVAAQMPAEIAGLAARCSERLAGVVLSTPTRLDPAPFVPVAGRLLVIAGDGGMSAAVADHAARELPSVKKVTLAGYDVRGWSDVVAERTDAVVGAMLDFLAGHKATTPAALPQQGSYAGISFTVTGQGPALVLLPYFLAPTQWDAALPRLAERFTVIALGGPHVGGVALLEDRARCPSYRGMVRTLLDVIAPAPGEQILDIGCGSGALDRLVVHRYGNANPLTAIDLNPFLLREAAALAAAEGMTIDFRRGNAEALPFDDASFDCLFSVTMLEECDADRALAEMYRVLRPGGRAGVIVRSIDLPQWWHLDLAEPVRAKAIVPPPSNSERGIADASLYRRAREAGFDDLTCFPALVTLDNPDGPVWRHREDHTLALLSASEAETWRGLAAAARAENLLFMAHPMHCVVGIKPL